MMKKQIYPYILVTLFSGILIAACGDNKSSPSTPIVDPTAATGVNPTAGFYQSNGVCLSMDTNLQVDASNCNSLGYAIQNGQCQNLTTFESVNMTNCTAAPYYASGYNCYQNNGLLAAFDSCRGRSDLINIWDIGWEIFWQFSGGHCGRNCDRPPVDTPDEPDEVGRILSAFYGVNNQPAVSDLNTCGFTDETRVDGLPVTFRQEIDQTTLDNDDIVVVLEDGTEVTPLCATLEPSPEENEDRTVLLSGLFGEPDDNPPVRVKVVGELLAEGSDDQDGISLQGLEADVIAFAEGPTVVYAEIIRADELELSDSTETISETCPESETISAVRLTWTGGVSRRGPGRLEITDEERLQYSVILLNDNGEEITVTPFAIGDLFDQDNMQDLCIDQPGTPLLVTVQRRTVVDPNGDFNPRVNVEVGPAE